MFKPYFIKLKETINNYAKKAIPLHCGINTLQKKIKNNFFNVTKTERAMAVPFYSHTDGTTLS